MRWSIVTAVLLLAGCSEGLNVGNLLHPALEYCGLLDNSGWSLLAAPPTSAADLLPLADCRPEVARNADVWFQHTDGRVMLCRGTDESRATWQFARRGAGWYVDHAAKMQQGAAPLCGE